MHTTKARLTVSYTECSLPNTAGTGFKHCSMSLVVMHSHCCDFSLVSCQSLLSLLLQSSLVALLFKVRSSGLPPQEAPILIAEKHKLVFSLLSSR